MPRIPELRDENGRDLLCDDTSSDKSSPKVETEWTSDAIRAFDRVWHDPARRKHPSCFQPGSALVFSGASSRTAASESRQTLAPATYAFPYRTITLEQSHNIGIQRNSPISFRATLDPDSTARTVWKKRSSALGTTRIGRTG
ncbi:hypothetical protein N7471_004475 [Penicillium samsonianum]|uniref:uncharacterized protein n=1 Tax=Penicillium samsonianum TaxID=1882272 RepID=UPI002546C129|nr:uncharacterized protein N7471_004475 [Penicillium samsonianum]KAJ6137989.1 hypothetical protein N7471_004475 [Penicillium samsonianum]